MINVFIMDISQKENISGVDRYTEMLLDGLSKVKYIKVYWIHFVFSNIVQFTDELSENGVTKVLIPLPINFDMIISDKYWMKRYNERVFHKIYHLFDQSSKYILHIQALNLIDLAILIRNTFSSKIVTHLHCIPWKGKYNTDKTLFRKLYKEYYFPEKPRNREEFLTNNSELMAYEKADRIICVTQCAKSFLTDLMEISTNKIVCISNGIYDFLPSDMLVERQYGSEPFKILFVGQLSESKGILFVLKAVKILVNLGYNVSLTIAGAKLKVTDNLFESFKGLPINYLGVVSFSELKRLYMFSDMGIIASLQEQCSYVALEMAMFGVPMIVTDVDGLSEIFTDRVNCLKLYVDPLREDDLCINVNQLVDKIIFLMKDSELRKKLSKNVRILYETLYTHSLMIEKVIGVYKSLY